MEWEPQGRRASRSREGGKDEYHIPITCSVPRECLKASVICLLIVTDWLGARWDARGVDAALDADDGFFSIFEGAAAGLESMTTTAPGVVTTLPPPPPPVMGFSCCSTGSPSLDDLDFPHIGIGASPGNLSATSGNPRCNTRTKGKKVTGFVARNFQ